MWQVALARTARFAVGRFLRYGGGHRRASVLFSLYLRVAPSYSATYGSLGAVIVLMLWLYLLGLALFIGGEIDSEIERAAGAPIVEKEIDGQPTAVNPSLESMGG